MDAIRRLAIATLALALPGQTLADVLFESSDEIVVVRVLDMFGTASVDVVAQGIDMVTCILLDANRKPLAVATGFVQNGAGQALAPDVDATAVASVQCNGSSM